MYTIQSFSSLMQATNAPLVNTANSLLTGLKIRIGQQWYICGKLALNEGTNPRRTINASPETLECQLLFKAALLSSGIHSQSPLIVTMGLPNSTYRLYKETAEQMLLGEHIIESDPVVYGEEGTGILPVNVTHVDVLPEIVSCMVALRRGESCERGAFFVFSFGFGTLETGLSTDEGVIDNAMGSAPGLHYAVSNMREHLQQTYDLSFQSMQQLDEAFRNGYIYINRKKIDLTSLRKKAIQTYYAEIVSPTLSDVVNDRNLAKTNRIFLCGGGAHYGDLVDCILDEFGDIAGIQIVDQPESLAVKGYLLNSMRYILNEGKTPLGIDIGNIQTRVASAEN
ncbi:ParM/StbA family protein [Sphingobacterium sp.]|uniref:ParM/StbA family protein n=1 Tax=Sphingobacterium sp. TaxID=341027 RepID=UPI002899EA4B|nr:ParM/StbA family protein [Sphingobacterium sp.]